MHRWNEFMRDFVCLLWRRLGDYQFFLVLLTSSGGTHPQNILSDALIKRLLTKFQNNKVPIYFICNL